MKGGGGNLNTMTSSRHCPRVNTPPPYMCVCTNSGRMTFRLLLYQSKII